jgi:hypothetical protein
MPNYVFKGVGYASTGQGTRASQKLFRLGSDFDRPVTGRLELQIMFGLLRTWSLYWTEVIGLPPNLSAFL